MFPQAHWNEGQSIGRTVLDRSSFLIRNNFFLPYTSDISIPTRQILFDQNHHNNLHSLHQNMDYIFQ